MEDSFNFIYSQQNFSKLNIDTGDWSLNQNIFDKLNYYFGPFQVDVCASNVNKKCSLHYTKSNSCFDNIVMLKGRHLFVNPPFEMSEKILKFILDIHNICEERKYPYPSRKIRAQQCGVTKLMCIRSDVRGSARGRAEVLE